MPLIKSSSLLFHRSAELTVLAQSVSQSQGLLTEIFLVAIVCEEAQGGGWKGKVLCTFLSTLML